MPLVGLHIIWSCCGYGANQTYAITSKVYEADESCMHNDIVEDNYAAQVTWFPYVANSLNQLGKTGVCLSKSRSISLDSKNLYLLCQSCL